ncbi:PREDICTED: G-protein-signaling modulator 2-like [Acropora digitifera]|uniref:G-protein-signaling modulator 2-like n=1 Tax=Acropora digitifera TaxID=70779 RepID=UPI00077AB9F2|nr:PREDICTED: G-protein-signaling modulator 2-like [Acropora digitifera]
MDNGDPNDTLHSSNRRSDYQNAIDYHEKRLKIAQEIGDRSGEGTAYENLGIAYHSLSEYRKAIEYHQRRMKLAQEIGDQSGEKAAYKNLGSTYHSLGDYRKAIKYLEKLLKIAQEIGDRSREGAAYGYLGCAYQLQGDCQKAIKYHEKLLKIAQEIGERNEEGIAYHKIGLVYFSLEQFQNAVDNFFSSIEAFNAVRSCLKSKDDWKIKFRDRHEMTYTYLWKSLLRIRKLDEALFAAERGRAQTLSDRLLIQYQLPAPLSAASMDPKETISRLSIEVSLPTLTK